MKRTVLMTVLVLTSAAFLCNSAFADKGPRTTSNKVLNSISSASIERWAFESRFVTMPKAAEVSKDRAAAEAGDAQAQFRMALRYDQGAGVRQDYAESVKWLQKAAEQGLPEAQFNLGSMYASGLGVNEDSTEAVAWYYRAALQGNASAQKNLGAMYGMGQGVAQNHSEAYAWSSIAVMSGNEEAATNRDVAASLLSADELQAAHQRAAELYQEIRQQG